MVVLEFDVKLCVAFVFVFSIYTILIPGIRLPLNW